MESLKIEGHIFFIEVLMTFIYKLMIRVLFKFFLIKFNGITKTFESFGCFLKQSTNGFLPNN